MKSKSIDFEKDNYLIGHGEKRLKRFVITIDGDPSAEPFRVRDDRIYFCTRHAVYYITFGKRTIIHDGRPLREDIGYDYPIKLSLNQLLSRKHWGDDLELYCSDVRSSFCRGSLDEVKSWYKKIKRKCPEAEIRIYVSYRKAKSR